LLGVGYEQVVIRFNEIAGEDTVVATAAVFVGIQAGYEIKFWFIKTCLMPI
jgi:hypothetical protein